MNTLAKADVPLLFMSKIKSVPMKGTIDATLPDAEAKLMNNEKEAAEHATIVDLIRNDLSMVADKVNVTSYRYIDRLQTNKGVILQTSSEVSGALPDNYHEKIGNILLTTSGRIYYRRPQTQNSTNYSRSRGL